MRQYRAAQRAAGLCAECQEPAPDGVRCAEHTERNTDAQQMRRARLKAAPAPAPVCRKPGCGAIVEYPGVRCVPCWLADIAE